MSTARRQLGDAVERAAEAMLERAGLRLLARQVANRYGEIDLVMRDHDVIVFVEVRYRAHSGFGGAPASVDLRKQARVIKAAQGYIVAHPEVALAPMRFDVIAADGPPDAPRFDWIRDAFRT
ncbi:MAG: YraN family protein [Ahniella sp.]|nr:YraN family protein [Ahniella sp.]